MKKLLIVIIILFSLLVFTFSFFGNDIYSLLVKHVDSTYIASITIADENYLVAPIKAVKNNKIYQIEKISCFKIDHYIAKEVEIIVGEATVDVNLIIVSGIPRGTMIISDAEGINDGDNVIIKK